MVLIYPLHRVNGGEAALFIAELRSSIAWPILTRGREFPSIGQMAQWPDLLMTLHMWLIPTGLE